mmetsp:Transcript_30507/g.68902  ORF Transcript_30507/g.68902 Transcript_30507/m.68902 type:complete len:234 (-) Transcript_30507:1-702(-)
MRRWVMKRDRRIVWNGLRPWPRMPRVSVRGRGPGVIVKRWSTRMRRAICVVRRRPARAELAGVPGRVCRGAVRMVHPLRRQIPVISWVRSWRVPRVTRRLVPRVVVRPARVPVVVPGRVDVLRVPRRPRVQVRVPRRVVVTRNMVPVIVRRRTRGTLRRAVPRSKAVLRMPSCVPRIVGVATGAHGDRSRLPEISTCSTASRPAESASFLQAGATPRRPPCRRMPPRADGAKC